MRSLMMITDTGYRIGAPNTPTNAISEQKRNSNNLDHSDWVRWWNAINVQDGSPDKEIKFYWADKFPIRTPTVLRAALVAPRLVPVLCTTSSPCHDTLTDIQQIEHAGNKISTCPMTTFSRVW